MKQVILTIVTMLLWTATLGHAREPFTVSASVAASNDGKMQLTVAFSIQPGHYLYADKTSVTGSSGTVLTPTKTPKPKTKFDKFLDKSVMIYDHDMEFSYIVDEAPGGTASLTVSFQGCSADMCFFPETKTFSLPLKVDGGTQPDKPPLAGPSTPQQEDRLLDSFDLAGKKTGYLPPDKFIAFLDNVEEGRGMEKDAITAAFDQKRTWLAILLIILGGLALNLTPCVLPMIPINLAIIGAGTQAGSRSRGFALGGVYGAGITVIYGGLGLLVVLTGAKFGSLNSNPWFNIGIAVVFVVLSLAMFGLFNIDFSRFQSSLGSGKAKGSYATAFFFGGVAALLAGACVAPVVISVLVLSANLYAAGNITGLLLPFLLGLAMALPWPFAGAGLSFLPKPGRWMEWIKYGFGVIILVTAAWYGFTGIKLLKEQSPPDADAIVLAQEANSEGGWLKSLDQGLELAAKENRLVFVDCWATWCKNCLTMEKTTFKDPAVVKKLEPYVKVKFQAEKLDDPLVKPVLDHFEAIGLPTFVVLKAKETKPSGK